MIPALRKEMMENLLKKTKKKGMSFEVWAGILLAAAALLITILGVFIAILSIYGYKKIMTSAQEAAASKSKEAAEHIMKTMIEKATTDALIDIIENGKLNSVINESVEKVVYRGIKIDNIEEEIEQ
ncbi:hypothetical protein RFI_15691 [Reticulomyxa filosa]|uniref:Uncharacterized protein n=1 Tax=Reticulomyxa filosa TaxID=46433 RepID=X6N883_RETFI|nr:hypothetical protein RFI_15691 [Reticulomyxa filosa]|eukprot:ETO21512.1 hypothetical protein RFI_15691 [Reticulomyxa filosa]